MISTARLSTIVREFKAKAEASEGIVLLAAAQAQSDHEQHIALLKKNLAKMKVGTHYYTMCVKEISMERKRYLDILMNLGILPKNLGVQFQISEKYDFKADTKPVPVNFVEEEQREKLKEEIARTMKKYLPAKT